MSDAPKSMIHRIKAWVPRSPWLRIPLGILFIIGGLLSFLPVLGIWMIPVGLIVLSYDFPPAKRGANWMIMWINRLTRSIRKSWRSSADNRQKNSGT